MNSEKIRIIIEKLKSLTKENSDRIIKSNLNLIKHNGDLYDVISKKKNVTPDNIYVKTLKLNVLIFSRILYLFLICTNKIKNSLASVEKIKKAQDEIRRFLGLPVDIIRTKDICINDNLRELGILYGDYEEFSKDKNSIPSIEDLENDLKKLRDFCITYNINAIYIDDSFLSSYLSREFLNNFEYVYHNQLLKYNEEEVDSYLNIKVNPQELNEIITKLKENKYDNEYIYSLKDKINDEVIKNAIETFKYDNDALELRRIVQSRLNMHINEEGIKKDRVYGKIYENYEIAGSFIKMSVDDNMGNPVSKNIISLYNYLEITDFSCLEKRTNNVTDNQEIDLISLLYLHLLGENPRQKKDTKNVNSLYDYIYNKYKTNPSNKNIPWIRTKIEKIIDELEPFRYAFCATLTGYVIALFLSRFIPNHWFLSESSLIKYNNFFKSIESAYENSSEMESNIIGRIKQTIEKYLPRNMTEEILDYAQDEIEEINKNDDVKIVAEVEWFSEEKKPLYFMNHYFENAYFYESDGVRFCWENQPIVGYGNVINSEPLFQIKTSISKSELKEDDMGFFNLPLNICPIGDDYILTEIIIKDELDPNKYLILDENWYDKNLWNLPYSEECLLQSMEKPMLYCQYGIKENCSLINFNRSYTKEKEEDVKKAIIKGLNLDESVTNTEINEKIATKSYTKYPLYKPKGNVNELEYYEKIASLDSIDIHLAAVLTTMANDGFVYTVGYKNINDDNYILTDEAYVWDMNEDGEVIDFLANLAKEETNTFDNEKASPQGKSKNSYNWSTNQENDYNYSYDNQKDKNKLSNEEKNEEEDDWVSLENDETKTILDKIRNWAKEYHIPYYIAAIIAVLIIQKIFGRQIELKLKFKNAYNILNDKSLYSTYNDLLFFIYGEESIAIERSSEEMVELIYKEFKAISEEEIEALLEELKLAIKEEKDNKSLKEVAKLLQTIPFIIEKRDELKRRLMIDSLKSELNNCRKEKALIFKKIE